MGEDNTNDNAPVFVNKDMREQNFAPAKSSSS